MREIPSVTAIRAEGLAFDYGRERGLDGVDLEVAAGERFAILGPNGGGKTTLFRILATLLKPARGRAAIFGHDVATSADAVRRALGVVFQAPAVDRLLTVRENLDLQGALYGVRGAALQREREALLDRFGLADRFRARAGTLSGGLLRRLEIAKALLHRPRLLLLDEPSTGLDPQARADLWQALDDQTRRDGTTVAFTTHLLDEGDRSDRVAILDRGRVVALGTPDALKAEIGRQVLVVAVEAPGDPGLRAEVERLTGHPAREAEGRILLDAPDGARLVPLLSEALGGRIGGISLSRPTLFDVFLRRTGHRFDAAPPQDFRGAGDAA
ncbi:MAG TPA: ATP-binding cassette domain-containing protein [Candidatus Polarisedimenticolia bacterium]|nr:ATP-binding cassette domain-containing protein [Candidatus Polarisedimenticolia bacterium]